MYRFYLPTLTTDAAGGDDRLQLPKDQSHHATHVLRLTPDTPILLFDGQGHHAPATIQLPITNYQLPARSPSKNLLLKLTSPIQSDPPPSPALTIAVAVPKADRADWLIEQASQLNVTSIQWLFTDRTIVKPKEAKLEKHHRLAIESAKQSHRTHLLQISPPTALDKLLKTLRPSDPQTLRPYSNILWLDPAPESRPIRDILPAFAPIPNTQFPIPTPPRLLALIGPEGGWSPREHTLLDNLAKQNQLTRIRLTPTILRIETAAAALAAIIMSA